MSDREKKMKEEFTFFAPVTLAYGMIFSICFYRNIGGSIMTFLFSIVTAIYLKLCFMKFNIAIKKDSYLYGAIYILLGLSNCLTADYRLLSLNTIAMLFLILFISIHQFYDDQMWSFGKYISSFFYIFMDTMLSIVSPFIDWKYSLETKQESSHSKSRYIFYGILIAAPILLVVIGLLSSADIVFRQLFQWLSDLIVSPFDLISVCVISLIVFFTMYALLRALTRDMLSVQKPEKEGWEPLTAITFTSLLAGVYLIFCVIQIVFLFFGEGRFRKIILMPTMRVRDFFSCSLSVS